MCSGIYGNSKEDQYFEARLFDYLDGEEEEYDEEYEEWLEQQNLERLYEEAEYNSDIKENR